MNYSWSTPCRSLQSVEVTGCSVLRAHREKQRQKKGPGGGGLIKEAFLEEEAFQLGLKERETLTRLG